MNTAFATGGTLFCIVGAVLVIGFVFLANAIRIIPEYQRLVVFRLGRVMQQPKGPGPLRNPQEKKGTLLQPGGCVFLLFFLGGREKTHTAHHHTVVSPFGIRRRFGEHRKITLRESAVLFSANARRT